MLAAFLVVTSALSSTCALKPGEHTLKVQAAGLEREALVVVGSAVSDAPPVVFAWHGFGGSPENIQRALSVDTLWRDAVVVLPRGTGRSFEQFGPVVKPGFQIHEGEMGDRDLALFDVLVEKLAKQGCLDARRVYATGFSNGGFMSTLLACRRASKLAAAAPVGGGGPFDRCEPGVPVRVSHGTADRVVPLAMAQATVENFSALNACARSPAPLDGACSTEKCKGDVEIAFCTEARGHNLGAHDAADVAAFFRRHAKASKR